MGRMMGWADIIRSESDKRRSFDGDDDAPSPGLLGLFGRILGGELAVRSRSEESRRRDELAFLSDGEPHDFARWLQVRANLP